MALRWTADPLGGAAPLASGALPVGQMCDQGRSAKRELDGYSTLRGYDGSPNQPWPIGAAIHKTDKNEAWAEPSRQLLMHSASTLVSSSATVAGRRTCSRRVPPSKNRVAAAMVVLMLCGFGASAASAAETAERHARTSEPRGRSHPATGAEARGSRVARGDDEDRDDDDDDDDDDRPHAGTGEGAGSSAVEEDEAQAFGWGGEVDIVSRYIWRGMALSDGPAAQVSAAASAQRFTAEIWVNALFQNEPLRHRLSAVEPSISYAYAWSRWQVEPIITGYWVREQPNGDVTAEAACRLSYGIGLFGERSSGPPSEFPGTVAAGQRVIQRSRLLLKLETTEAVDVGRHPGAYIGTLGSVLKYQVGGVRMLVFVDAAWANSQFNQVYWDEDRWLIEYVEAGLDLRLSVSDAFYVSMHFAVSSLVAPSLREASEEPTLVNAGLLFGVDM